MAFSTTTDIFSDAIVTAKELNRQPGRILDLALEGPVTITRNSETFALMPREDVTSLIQSVKVSRLALEATTIAYQLMRGKKVSADHPYAWLMDFDRDDIEDFAESITSTFYRFSDSPEAWDEVDAVIFEWHESALINASGVLDEMLTQKV